MGRSAGLDSVVKYLKNERDRFLRAANSGMFCDTQSCYETAHIINQAINDISKNREKLNR